MKLRLLIATSLVALAACGEKSSVKSAEPSGTTMKLAALRLTRGKTEPVELKADGSIFVDGKWTAKIAGDHVEAANGTSLLTVAANGRLVGGRVEPGFLFVGDELYTDAGAKLSVRADGAVVVAKDRGIETIAKVEGGIAAKRAALVLAVLWLELPMYVTTDTSRADVAPPTPAASSGDAREHRPRAEDSNPPPARVQHTSSPREGGASPLSIAAPSVGTIDVTVVADAGAAHDDVVSFGVPFPQGVLTDEKLLGLRTAAGRRVPIGRTLLARWPADGSIRSVLVAFKATLAAGAKETWRLDYGATPASPSVALAANPDGPATAVLTAEWYAKSRVGGILLPVAANQRFASYDALLADAFGRLDLEHAGVDCPITSAHRTYYDGPHAQYQRFFRTGDPAHYRSARKEAIWYRKHEVTFYDGRKMAVQVCQNDDWNPDVPIAWSVLRRMASEGNLDDYLVTGDPAARELVLAFGEAYRRNLPALTWGALPSIEATERNLAWTMMGLASYYALDARPEVKAALVALVDRAVAWQSRGASGGLEHDVKRVDPTECRFGPKGASAFMTSLVVDGVMDYWALTGDTAKVEPLIRKLAVWFETKALTSDKKAFRYLWNCEDDAYDRSDMAYLNLLIGHVFGAAYMLTRDSHWLDFGDAMADNGIDRFDARHPKEWNQAARSFGRYLGYRAYGKVP